MSHHILQLLSGGQLNIKMYSDKNSIPIVELKWSYDSLISTLVFLLSVRMGSEELGITILWCLQHYDISFYKVVPGAHLCVTFFRIHSKATFLMEFITKSFIYLSIIYP